MSAPTRQGTRTRLAMVDEDRSRSESRPVEASTGFARTHRHTRRSLFDSPEYRQMIKGHAQLIRARGTPPFEVSPRRRPRGPAILLRGSARGP